MKMYKFLLIILLFSSRLFSQALFDPIIDTAANYSNNSSYDIGEVYVIFNIMSDQIVSKSINHEEIIDIGTIKIYPNPFNDILNITTTDGKDIGKMELYSIDGRKIKDMIAIKNQIDLTGLPNGTYILKTEFSGSTAFKIIKL